MDVGCLSHLPLLKCMMETALMARKFWQSLSPHREGKKGAHPIPVDKTVKRGGMREDTLLKEDHIQENAQ